MKTTHKSKNDLVFTPKSWLIMGKDHEIYNFLINFP